MSWQRSIVERVALTVLLALGSLPVMGDQPYPAMQGPPAPPQAMPNLARPNLGPSNFAPSPPPSPYESAWPPPGQDVRAFNAGRQDWTTAPEHPAVVSVVPAPASIERLIESSWYFRQEAFYWNERSDGTTFVNERGPLSTLGYVHRCGIERFRFEVFGGSMDYDGGAQGDGTYEPYHQSFGTNYLGVRGEYDLLIEPASWSRMRAIIGVGTRFWIRDLHDSVTPSGDWVDGYQEDWWSFYPYVGLETKESDEPGPKLFGSARFGLTPLTYQYVSYFDTALYPKCGVTAQAELGVRFQKFAVSAYLEVMTWGESAVVRDIDQPDSRMFTFGGKLSYTF